MKRELFHNAFNAEVSKISQSKYVTTKAHTQSLEVDAVHSTRPFVVLKKKKNDEIISEVRSRKMAELAEYKKNRPADKKYQDI